MNPIGTLIELLVIGVQTATAAYFVAGAIGAFGGRDALPAPGESLLILIISAWAYTLAVMVDRLADDLQERIAENGKGGEDNAEATRDKSRAWVTWWGGMKNAPKEDRNFRESFYAVARLQVPEIDRTVAYYRSRVRISRATRLTVPLTVLGAMGWLLARQCWLGLAAVAVAGTGVSVLSWRVASVMYLKYHFLIKGILETLGPSGKGQSPQ